MTPSKRTPQQRDRRFARARRFTQAIFLGSCATSALFVGYAANAAHSVTTVAVTPPSQGGDYGFDPRWRYQS